MKRLTTPFATVVHATFSALTVILTCELLAGNHGPGGNYGLGLLFCLVAYGKGCRSRKSLVDSKWIDRA